MERARLNRRGDTRGNPEWVKGNKKHAGPGRPKGSINKNTKLLKDAWIEAAELLGSDGKGKDALVGYLLNMAEKHPMLFGQGLIKLIPLHIYAKNETEMVYATKEEMIQELKRRGIPYKQIFPD